MTTTEATTAAPPLSPVANADRERIAAIAEALTGERHEVTTERRRGYWYAICGKYESEKGVQGADGERWALERLREEMVERAERADLGGLRYNGRRLDDAERAEQGAAKALARARQAMDEARAKTAIERALYDDKRAACDDRQRAIYDALRRA